MSAIYYVNIVGECILGVVSIVGNGLVLLLIAKDIQLQTITNYFVASLALADLLVGLVGIPCVLVTFHGMPYNFYGCLLVNATIVILTQISIFGLLTIAIERFIAIKDPFRYTRTFTVKVAATIVGATWITAILVGLVPVFGWNLGASPAGAACAFVEVIDMKYMVYFNFFVCVLLPLVIMLYVYIYIYQVVRKQMKQIASLRITTVSDDDGKIKKHRLNVKQEIKAAKWFAVVILLFAICWLPLHIMNTVSLLAGKINFPALIAAILLSHLNSAVNPLLYALGNQKFQKAWKKIFRMGSSQNSIDRTTLSGSDGFPNPSAT